MGPTRRSATVRPDRSAPRLAHRSPAEYNHGYEDGLSVPDEIFEKGEATAKRLKISRSELYSRALQAFIDSHSPDEGTSAGDAVISELGQPDTVVSAHASRSVFAKTEW